MAKKATRAHIREHNTRLVLQTVFEHDEISRADIARETGLTRTTISNIVSELMNAGLLDERGTAPSPGGKPPTLVGMPEDARQSICIDLSDDEYYGAIVNLRGKVLYRQKMVLGRRRGEAALRVAFDLIESLMRFTTAPLLGIGVGTPGLVDTYKGIIRQAVNRGWTDLPLRQLLADRYDLPVHIANDSHMTALAEYTFGSVEHSRNLVVIQVSEGIGSGIVLDGKLFYGDGFGAGEIGHLSVVDDGDLCTCGNWGCLETIASMPAILRRAHTISRNNGDSMLATNDEITRSAFTQALHAGDPVARQVIDTAGTHLGVTIANLIAILNIHTVVIAGDVVGFGDLLLDSVREEIQRCVLPRMADETTVVSSSLGDDAAILGASALVLTKELGLP